MSTTYNDYWSYPDWEFVHPLPFWDTGYGDPRPLRTQHVTQPLVPPPAV